MLLNQRYGVEAYKKGKVSRINRKDDFVTESTHSSAFCEPVHIISVSQLTAGMHRVCSGTRRSEGSEKRRFMPTLAAR